jgi:hypothetical protein
MCPKLTNWTALAAATTALAAPATGAAPAHAAAAPSPPVQVPILVLHGSGGQALVIAPVSIKGRRALFVVDTGASASLIDKRTAKKLRLPKVGRVQHFSGVGCGGSAQPVRVSNWSLGSLRLASRRISSTKFAFAGGRVVGLLGSDVLSSFGKVSIDFTHNVMTLGG